MSRRKDTHVIEQPFELVADIGSGDPAAIEPVLRQLIDGKIFNTTDSSHLEATVTGSNARDLNRSPLSALRKVQRRTRLRAEWASGSHLPLLRLRTEGQPTRSPATLANLRSA